MISGRENVCPAPPPGQRPARAGGRPLGAAPGFRTKEHSSPVKSPPRSPLSPARCSDNISPATTVTKSPPKKKVVSPPRRNLLDFSSSRSSGAAARGSRPRSAAARALEDTQSKWIPRQLENQSQDQALERERALKLFKSLHQAWAACTKGTTLEASLKSECLDALASVRHTTVDVAVSVNSWRTNCKHDDAFMFRGCNYLQKMLHDLTFLDEGCAMLSFKVAGNPLALSTAEITSLYEPSAPAPKEKNGQQRAARPGRKVNDVSAAPAAADGGTTTSTTATKASSLPNASNLRIAASVLELDSHKVSAPTSKPTALINRLLHLRDRSGNGQAGNGSNASPRVLRTPKMVVADAEAACSAESSTTTTSCVTSTVQLISSEQTESETEAAEEPAKVEAVQPEQLFVTSTAPFAEEPAAPFNSPVDAGNDDDDDMTFMGWRMNTVVSAGADGVAVCSIKMTEEWCFAEEKPPLPAERNVRIQFSAEDNDAEEQCEVSSPMTASPPVPTRRMMKASSQKIIKLATELTEKVSPERDFSGFQKDIASAGMFKMRLASDAAGPQEESSTKPNTVPEAALEVVLCPQVLAFDLTASAAADAIVCGALDALALQQQQECAEAEAAQLLQEAVLLQLQISEETMESDKAMDSASSSADIIQMAVHEKLGDCFQMAVAADFIARAALKVLASQDFDKAALFLKTEVIRANAADKLKDVKFAKLIQAQASSRLEAQRAKALSVIQFAAHKQLANVDAADWLHRQIQSNAQANVIQNAVRKQMANQEAVAECAAASFIQQAAGHMLSSDEVKPVSVSCSIVESSSVVCDYKVNNDGTASVSATPTDEVRVSVQLSRLK